MLKAKTRIKVSSIDISKTSLSLYTDESENLTCKAASPSSIAGTKLSCTWTSSNPSIATVDSTGKVTGIDAGRTTITAKYGSCTDSIQVSVYLPEEEYKARYITEMVRLVNKLRTDNGLGPVENYPQVQSAADQRALEAFTYPSLGHNRYTASGAIGDCFTIFPELGLSAYTGFTCGENLAWTSSYKLNPEEMAAALYKQWYNSTGHRNNMMNSGFNRIATSIKYRNASNGIYSVAAVQLFVGI